MASDNESAVRMHSFPREPGGDFFPPKKPGTAGRLF